MPRIELIPARRARPELRGAYRRAAALWGLSGERTMAMQILQCFAHRPHFVEEIARGYHYVGWGGHLPRTVRETVAVWVSRENECFYCLTAHAAVLQAAGMKSEKALRFAEGELRAEELQPGELAIAELVHKSVIAPARLEPQHLAKLVGVYGQNGALELVAVLVSFHFINRIADLVGIRSELPLIQRRWARLRRLGVRLQGRMMGRMLDLSNREIEVDTRAALREANEVLGPLPGGYKAVLDLPNVAAFLAGVARITRQLDPVMVERVSEMVADALPTCEAEAVGFHARPSDPIEALAFVGTRYAVRTSDAMVTAVREKYGYGDPELTDLFYAISMRNALERMHRLLAKPLPRSWSLRKA